MPSTYSSLKFELIATGEQSGTWGVTTDNNIGTAIEQAIVGMATLTAADFTANVATLTLTNTNAAQNARALCLNIAAGAVSAAGTINVPAIQKPYIIINGSSYTVTVKVSGLTGVAVPTGKRTVVYNNGTDVEDQISFLSSLTLLTALPAASGGTGQSSYAVGDLLYASTTTALSKLADVATGNALISGGVGVAPSYGKIALTTHVSGTLPTANGGTGLTSFTANGVVYASSSSALTTGSALGFDGTNLSIGTTAFNAKFTVSNSGAAGLEFFAASPSGGTGTYIQSFNRSGAAYIDTFYYAASHTWRTNASATSMVIDTSGNVGIGISSPTSILNVKAASPIFRLETASTVSSGGVAYNAIRDSTGSDVFINGFAGLANCYQFATTAAAGFMRFLTGASVEAVRIDSSGNVGIGTSSPNASAILDAQSTTKGVRMPNMTTTQKNAISSPAAGLMVFDTTLSKLCVYSGAAWQTVTSV